MKIFGFNISRSAPVVINEQKDSAIGPLLWMQNMGKARWTPRNYAELARESYMQNAIAYRCVRMIAEAAASIPFIVREGEDEMDEHPILELLNKPNPFEGGSMLLESFYSFLKIAGNTYLEAVMLDSTIKELYILRPDRMKIVIGPRGYPSAYEYNVGQNTYRFDIPDPGKQLPILHMREFHPLEDFYGMSPVEAGAFAVDVHNSAGAFNKALLDNQARPSGALVYNPPNENADPSLTDKQFDRLRTEIENKFSGRQNAGRPMILDGGLDWKEMSINPRDMEFVEGKREAAREIALAYGIPPQLLGIPGDNTYSNYQEANRAFYRSNILPLVTKTCEAMTNFFAPSYGEKLMIDFDEDKIPALSEEREKLWTRVTAATWLTTNEKREATGYDEYEEAGEDGAIGDAIMIQSSLVPLADLTLTPGGGMDPNDPENTDTQDTDVQSPPDKVGKPAGSGNPKAPRKPKEGDAGKR